MGFGQESDVAFSEGVIFLFFQNLLANFKIISILFSCVQSVDLQMCTVV